MWQQKLKYKYFNSKIVDMNTWMNEWMNIESQPIEIYQSRNIKMVAVCWAHL